MLSHLAPADAYRADLARHRSGRDLSPASGAWLLAATMLQRGTRAPVARALLADALATPPIDASADDEQAAVERAVLQRVARAAAGHDVDELSAAIRTLAARMEDAGALSLADYVLAALVEAVSGIGAVERSRIVAHRARLARQSGDDALAAARYREVLRVARALRNSELAALGGLGLAVQSLLRGNLPDAGRRFARAARHAEIARVRDLARSARHGQLIVAAKRGDYSDAVIHGWQAFGDSAGDAHQEAEALSNLAAVMSHAGHDDIALTGFLAALDRKPVPRILVPALSGAALSAARTGDARLARALCHALEREVDRVDLAYQSTDALLSAAEAMQIVGDEPSARRYRDRALELGRAHQFHELVFRAEELLARTPAAPAPATLTRAAQDVCARVGELEPTGPLASVAG